MILAAWNVNSLKVRLPQLLDFLATRQPDAVCLQETKLTDENFPVAELEAAGYQVAFTGQKTYNGVAIVSRHPIADVQFGIPGFADEQKRVVAGTVGGVRLVGVDYLSVEQFHSGHHLAHRTLLGAGVVIVEGLSLAGVAPGDYDLRCLPLRVAGCDGAPARAVLVAG